MTRRLQPWEIDLCTPIAAAFHAESGLGTSFKEDVFLHQIRIASAQSRLFIGASFSGEEIVGCLCGIVSPHLMTGQIVAQELFWYILPEHRGKRDGVILLSDFEAWASEKKADVIIMASFLGGGGEPVGVTKLYQRRGYTPIETHHIKHL